MSPKERKYLRALYHHFEDKRYRGAATADIRVLVQERRDYEKFIQGVYLVLTLNDEDWQSEEMLNDLFEENHININIQ